MIGWNMKEYDESIITIDFNNKQTVGELIESNKRSIKRFNMMAKSYKDVEKLFEKWRTRSLYLCKSNNWRKRHHLPMIRKGAY